MRTPFLSLACLLLVGLVGARNSHIYRSEGVFEAEPAVHIATNAQFHANRILRGQQFSLIVSLDRSAAGDDMTDGKDGGGRRHSRAARSRLLMNRNRAQGQAHGHHSPPPPVNTTNYSLLVTAPAGFHYRAIAADPRIELPPPQPAPQGPAHSLVWPRVPLPQYEDLRAVQVLRLTFDVTRAAVPGRHAFTASVWEGNNKIHESQQDVTVETVGI